MLAIVAAFREEVSDYLNRWRFREVDQDNHLRFYYRSRLVPDVVVVQGGPGKQNAVGATEQLIDRYNPDFLISAGFAGSVQEDIQTGHLFVCDKLLSIEGPAPLWQSDSAHERLPGDTNVINDIMESTDMDSNEYSFCACMSVPELVSGSHMKEWLGSTFPISIIDMESYWVSEAAASHGIPHVVVRTVFDPLGQTLPSFVGKAMDYNYKRRWLYILNHIAKNPTEIPYLIKLAQQAKVARLSLRRMLDCLTQK